MSLVDTYMEKVDAVNASTDQAEKLRLDLARGHWLEGVQDAGWNIGHIIIEADLIQIGRGYEGPMCGGVYL